MPNKGKIYDKGKVIFGLIVFGILISFPFWYNLGKAAPEPEPVLTEKAKAAKACIRSTDYMTAEHMQLLDIWRDAVSRDGKRIYVNPEGKSFNMSLTKTCLDCHSNKAEFCDSCHNYAAVKPFCWDCHIDNPEELK